MAQYIERALANDALINSGIVGNDLEKAVNAICSVPAADVAPVVRGEWEKTHRHTNSYRKYTGFDEMGEEHTIIVHEELEYDWLKCPYCGASAADNFQNFCPNCGAKMDGDADA